MRLSTTLAAAATALLLGLSTAAPAAEPAWPTQNVRFIVPVLAGGGVDVAARIFAEELSARWKRPVVVEKRAGADGIIGVRAMLGAKDGHTLLFAPTFVAAGLELMHADMPFDGARDLEPIAGTVGEVLGVTVPATSGVKTLDELIARARKERLTYSAPPGVSSMLAAALLKRTGVTMTYVPYRSIFASLPDLQENRLQMAMLPLSMTVSQIRAGKLRVLAVSDENRWPVAPDVKTFRELGHDELTYSAVLSLYGQKGIRPALRDRIAAETLAIAKDPKMAARLREMGWIPMTRTPAELATHLAKQRERWKVLAAKYDLKPRK
jgi:tripartite-type tricarboxylate transporter receptor subunit TctC